LTAASPGPETISNPLLHHFRISTAGAFTGDIFAQFELGLTDSTTYTATTSGGGGGGGSTTIPSGSPSPRGNLVPSNNLYPSIKYGFYGNGFFVGYDTGSPIYGKIPSGLTLSAKLASPQTQDFFVKQFAADGTPLGEVILTTLPQTIYMSLNGTDVAFLAAGSTQSFSGSLTGIVSFGLSDGATYSYVESPSYPTLTDIQHGPASGSLQSIPGLSGAGNTFTIGEVPYDYSPYRVLAVPAAWDSPVTITATLTNSAGSAVSLTPSPVPGGSSVTFDAPLTVSNNTIAVTVSDGSLSYTYSLNVSRSAPNPSLTSLSYGEALSPMTPVTGFSGSTTFYTLQSVGRTISYLYFEATVPRTTVAVTSTVNNADGSGQPVSVVTSGQLNVLTAPLAYGLNTISIVTAEGDFTRTYTVEVSRDYPPPTLLDLKLGATEQSATTLTGFDSGVYTYTPASISNATQTRVLVIRPSAGASIQVFRSGQDTGGTLMQQSPIPATTVPGWAVTLYPAVGLNNIKIIVSQGGESIDYWVYLERRELPHLLAIRHGPVGQLGTEIPGVLPNTCTVDVGVIPNQYAQYQLTLVLGTNTASTSAVITATQTNDLLTSAPLTYTDISGVGLVFSVQTPIDLNTFVFTLTGGQEQTVYTVTLFRDLPALSDPGTSLLEISEDGTTYQSAAGFQSGVSGTTKNYTIPVEPYTSSRSFRLTLPNDYLYKGAVRSGVSVDASTDGGASWSPVSVSTGLQANRVLSITTNGANPLRLRVTAGSAQAIYDISVVRRAPFLVGATAQNRTTIEVFFTEAWNTGNLAQAVFAVQGLSVTSKTLSGNNVILTTGEQVPGSTYSMTISGVTAASDGRVPDGLPEFSGADNIVLSALLIGRLGSTTPSPFPGFVPATYTLAGRFPNEQADAALFLEQDPLFPLTGVTATIASPGPGLAPTSLVVTQLGGSGSWRVDVPSLIEYPTSAADGLRNVVTLSLSSGNLRISYTVTLRRMVPYTFTASGRSPTLVRVAFTDEPGAQALVASNYSIPGLTVLSVSAASASPGNLIFNLATSTQAEGSPYTLTVSGVDASPNTGLVRPLEAASAAFTGYLPFFATLMVTSPNTVEVTFNTPPSSAALNASSYSIQRKSSGDPLPVTLIHPGEEGTKVTMRTVYQKAVLYQANLSAVTRESDGEPLSQTVLEFQGVDGASVLRTIFYLQGDGLYEPVTTDMYPGSTVFIPK